MSLKVWLPLNGDLHNQGLDNIIVTNDGAIINDNGKIGKCYYSNNSLLTFPSFSTTRSICFWIKAPKTNSTIAMVDYKSYLGFGFNANGYIIPNCWPDSSNQKKMYASTNFIANEWNHIALIRDDNFTDVVLYINGILQTERSGTNEWDNNIDNCCFFGRSNGSNKMSCYLNDLRIYDHALSAKEVREVYKGLVLHIKLDGGGIGNENLATPDYGPPMLASTNPISASESKWVLSQQTGGCTYAEVTEDNGETYTQITRDSVAHSGWGMLYYRDVQLSSLQPDTWYTVSFEVKSSVDGEINWTGIVQTNATNYLTDSSTRKVVQNKVKANEWRKIVASVKTVADSDALANASSQVIYFSLSSLLWATGVVLQLRHIKLEQGLLATIWTPSSSDDYRAYESYFPWSMYPYIYDCSGYNNILTNDLPYLQLIITNATETPPRYNGAFPIVGSGSIFQ